MTIEPDFQEEKVKREALRRRAETPKGKRKGDAWAQPKNYPGRMPMAETGPGCTQSI
jgi:hypothetical protein